MSPKSGTSVKRGGTFAKRTCPAMLIPKGNIWQHFLQDSETKKKLFNFLSDELKEVAKDEHYHYLSPRETLPCQAKNVIYLP